ncbi:MAG: hypothetical protein IPO18_06080 [bacterium]|nr:hypothetical protein [bacterium]
MLPRVRDRPQEYQEVLLLMSWESLVALRRYRCGLDSDHAALWSSITWALLYVARRMDLACRTQLLGVKLMNDTDHHFRAQYARERRLQSTLTRVGDAEEGDSAGWELWDRGSDDPAFAAADLNHDYAWVRPYLGDLVRRGLLDRTDHQIIVGSYIYGHALKKLAERFGLSQEATKKRRQRALAYLRVGREKSCPGLAPTPPCRDRCHLHSIPEEPR